ncbi:killer cell lectin-like receptor subfamily B member 1B allele B isoform X2 [Aquarana catesbeiana]|uniref:killer cell lectin-like receptor subfamily B member 1B allele B isoform X2 n=1 Tax=Aquarana catesbeiana TaxID=8400 RepID=UPI003CC9CBB6
MTQVGSGPMERSTQKHYKSEKKLWRPSWKGVIITFLVGSNIILIRIIEALVYKGQSLQNEISQWKLSSAGCMVCPSGWLRHGENCYNISSGGEYRTWNESREVCEGMGAHLLVIEDRGQQEFINGSIIQHTDGRFWIGLYRDGDGWRWVDGRLYNTGLFHLSGSSGDCVWWEADSGYYRDRCQSKHSWICQKRSLKI